LKPDAVAILAPAILNHTADAERFERGEVEELDLEAFAGLAADFLERIPATVRSSRWSWPALRGCAGPALGSQSPRRSRKRWDRSSKAREPGQGQSLGGES